MGKGSNTTSNTSTSSADPQAAQLYRDILSKAQGVASTPYQAYSGELTAPVNAQQTAGIGNINANANYASPYISQAAGLAGASSSPITASTIQQYQNPYTQQVIDATTAQMGHDNQSAMANLQGNQIAQGALGGNATGVAKGILAGQQGRTEASTVAGLYNQSYQQALGAAQQQQQTGLAGANALANYGISGQNAALAGAGAQINAGTLQQQTQQQQDTSNYGQFTQQQAYPYQQLQWLAGLGTGVGSNLGGTSSGTTTAPAPNQTAQYLGAGLSAAGLFLSDREAKEAIEKIGTTNDGQNIYRYRYKGRPGYHIGLIAQEVKEDHPEAVQRHGGLHYVDLKGATDDAVSRASGGGVGGTPWEGAQGWIPTMQIHGGSGAPHGSAPAAPSNQGVSAADASKLASGITSFGKGVQGLDWSGAYGAGMGNLSGDSWGGGSFMGGDAYGGSSASPLPGLSAADYGYAAGGGVMGYAPSNSSVDDTGINDWLRGVPTPPPDVGPTFADRWDDRVRGRDGPPIANFEERSAPTRNAIAGGDFDPQGANSTTFDGTPAMQAANTGVVPMPRPRPEAAGASDDDDEEVPADGGVAPGGGGQPPVMAFGRDGTPTSYRGAPDAITRPRGGGDEPGFGLGLLSRNAQTGLLAAGLGMLSSRSPNLGNAIGDGAQSGLAAYGAANESDRKAAAEADKLSREAQKTQFDQGMSGRKQTETERHNRAAEDSSDKAPSMYIKNKDGSVSLRPGAEDSVARLTAAKQKLAPGSSIDADTADFLADRLRVGDNKALTGLGHGLQGSNNILEVQRRAAAREASGVPIMDSARSVQSNTAANAGLIAAERTQAQIMAKLTVYGRSAYNAADLALEASKEFPRTSFPKVNAAIASYRSNTGDPGIKAFGQAVTTLANEYARAVGGGHGTVHQQEQAERRLSETQSPEQFAATVAMMKREIVQAEHAMPAARQQIREIYAPGSKGSTTSIEGTKAPADTAQGFDVPSPDKREKNKVYKTPRGELMWNGTGWVQP